MVKHLRQQTVIINLLTKIASVKQHAALVFGDTTSILRQGLDAIKKDIKNNKVPPRQFQEYLYNLNRTAASRSTTISQECVVGYIMQSGQGEITPYGIDDEFYMLPFLSRMMCERIAGFELKVDSSGKQLPLKWIGLSFNKSQQNALPDSLAFMAVIRNAERPVMIGEEAQVANFYDISKFRK